MSRIQIRKIKLYKIFHKEIYTQWLQFKNLPGSWLTKLCKTNIHSTKKSFSQFYRKKSIRWDHLLRNFMMIYRKWRPTSFIKWRFTLKSMWSWLKSKAVLRSIFTKRFLTKNKESTLFWAISWISGAWQK